MKRARDRRFGTGVVEQPSDIVIEFIGGLLSKKDKIIILRTWKTTNEEGDLHALRDDLSFIGKTEEDGFHAFHV